MKTYFPSLLLVLTLVGSNAVFAHWTTRGPYGGSVTCLHVQDTTVWVGTENGGIYRNTNSNMLAWRYYNYTGLTSGKITAITSLGRKVVVGTADAGLFISDDRGATWYSSNTGLLGSAVDALILDGTNSNLLLGSGGNIYVSADSGVTWVAAPVLLAGTVTDFEYTGALFASTAGAGVYRSTDDGITWTQLGTGLPNLNVTGIAYENGYIFAATPAGIFATGIAGGTWNPFNTGMPTNTVHDLVSKPGTLYAATDMGLFTSPSTVAVNWTATTGYAGDVTAFALANGKAIAGTLVDGLYKSASQDTLSWTAFNHGFNNLKGHAIYNDGNLVLAATNKGFYVSHDLAANYATAHNGLTDSLHVMCMAFWGSDLYVGTAFGGVFMSPDTGQTWTAVNTGLGSMDIVAICGADSFLLAATAGGAVYRLPVGSNVWVNTTGIAGTPIITAIVTDGNTAFFSTNGDGIFKRVDGQAWTSFNAGLTNMDVTSLAVKAGYLFAGTLGHGVFRTGMTTAAWNAVGTAISSQDILSLCAAGPWVVAGYRGGVDVTYDDGVSWYAPNTLLYLPEFADVQRIHFTGNSTRIFVATADNSFYSNNVQELPVGMVAAVSEAGDIMVYPNPCSGDFTLDLSDVKGKVLSVCIYDNLGRMVGCRVSSLAVPQVDVRMDGPAGMYYVVVSTAQGRISRKVVME